MSVSEDEFVWVMFGEVWRRVLKGEGMEEEEVDDKG